MKEKVYTRRGVTYRVLSTGIHVKIAGPLPTEELPQEGFFNAEPRLNPDAIPLVIVFSYNRPDMLLRNLIDLRKNKTECRIVVIDDGSEYDHSEHSKYCEYQRFDHHGKEGFWKLWNIALQIARVHGSEITVFSQDDMLRANIDMMLKDVSKFPELFTCNLINDGRESNWGGRVWEPYKKKWIEGNFTECSFFCPYAVLEKLEFKINPISNREGLSSGVGRQITLRLREKEVPMYVPVKSYAFHGDHESVMHPEGRKTTPLISQ